MTASGAERTSLSTLLRTCHVQRSQLIEDETDRVLLAQRLRRASGEQEARDVVALNVAAHQLENLIHDRRLLLGSQQVGAPRN